MLSGFARGRRAGRRATFHTPYWRNSHRIGTTPVMHREASLITAIAAALGFGLLFGMLAVRITLPARVGYLAAGVVIEGAARRAPHRPARRAAADRSVSARRRRAGRRLAVCAA